MNIAFGIYIKEGCCLVVKSFIFIFECCNIGYASYNSIDKGWIFMKKSAGFVEDSRLYSK